MDEHHERTYKLYRMIGKGSYGEVWLARCPTPGRDPVVVKKVDVTRDNIKAVVKEAKLLRRLSHPNVIGFRDCFLSGEMFVLVMEFAERGDLDTFIYRRGSTPFREEFVWFLFLQIASGLRYLHRQSIIHRDIKPKNVLFTESGFVKIADFGLGRLLRRDELFAQTFVGTPAYLSPEICLQQEYDTQTDMWSLGCLLYEIVAKQKPFVGATFLEVTRRIISGALPEIPGGYSELVAQVLGGLLVVDPARRMTVEELFALGPVQQVASLAFGEREEFRYILHE